MADEPVRVEYEPPHIDDRAEIGPPLVAGPTVGSPLPDGISAVFRPADEGES